MTARQEDLPPAGPWLIQTKLSPPVSNSELIDRPIALAEIDKISTHKVGFITAPAGYGKTSLLSQWSSMAQKDSTAVAWVSLDKSDIELRQFASYCILALAKSGTGLGQLEFSATQCLVETAASSIVPRLVAEISKTDKTIVLILDDYHLVDCKEISGFLISLISYAPQNLKLLVSSRAVPHLEASSLIAAGQAFEVGLKTLRFSLDEMRSFFGDTFDETGLSHLQSETEGWAVALQLAKLAPREQQTHGALPPIQREHIANYFVEQILRHCSENERNFLLRTSIFDRFTPSLAATVCGRIESNDVFQNSTLVRPLLIRLDSEEKWYRYHHLFSELLNEFLNRTSPELLPTLHVEASCWFEESGDILNAVSHATQAGDIGRAAQLVLDAGGWELVLFGGVSFLRTLVNNFSSQEFLQFPRLRIANAYSLMKDGATKEAASQLSLIELGKNFNKLTEREKRDYIVIKSLLDTYQDALNSDSSYAELREVLDTWPVRDALGVGCLQAAAAITANARWEFNLAISAANSGVNSMRQADSVLGINYCYIHLGQAAFYGGDLELSNAHLEEASNMAEDNFGADSRLKTNCDIIIQSINYWRDHTEFDAQSLFSLLKIACDTDSWFDIYYTGFTTLFEYSFALRDVALARAVLDLCTATCRKREIARLSLLLPFFRLSAAMTEDDDKNVLLAANQCAELRDSFEDSCTLSANCIPISESSLIMGRNGAGELFEDGALLSLDNAIGFAKERSANFFLIRLLILRGRINAERRGVQAGYPDILTAARYAARASIKTPFAVSDDTATLVRAAIRYGRDKPENRLEVAFLGECLSIAISNRFGKLRAEEKTLSARELDVLTELSVGQSNKEIARALDMTDHTVKFHLKNIFSKLEVDNRISAINAGRELGLIN